MLDDKELQQAKLVVDSFIQEHSSGHPMFTDEDMDSLNWLISTIEGLKGEVEQLKTARPIDEWGEDYGDVLWWTFPIEEPPYCGSPLCSDWPDFHTHWTPIVEPLRPPLR